MTPAWLRKQVLLYAGRIAKYATLASTSDRAGYGQVDGPPVDAAEGEQASTQPVRILQWFGFRSRPVKNSECLVIAARGGATNAVLAAADSFGHGPTDLKEGEVAIFCKKSGTLIKLDENGKITIDAPNPQDVVVNGGTLKVARDTDPVKSTADFVTWATAVKAQIIAAGGADVGLPPTTIGTINGGATRFKG